MSDVTSALQSARDVAATLADAAIRDDGMAGWGGATAPAALGLPAVWQVFGGDYYEGSSGVARFLALMVALGVCDRATGSIVHEALAHALARSEGWSLHSGRLGVGMVAREAGALLGDPDLWTAGTEACLEAVEAAVDAADAGTVMGDMLAGLAGVLHCAARLARTTPEPWRRHALRLGSALANLAVPAEAGLAWPMHPEDPQLLCGMAHGAAGVAHAFGDLAIIDPDEPRWPGLAAAARRFERAHFNGMAASWADLRSDSEHGQHEGSEPPCPHFWCHGSVGVAWERLYAHRAFPECPMIGADLAAGLHGARREAVRVLAGPVGPGANQAANASQCHGLAGLIDLLVETGEAGDRVLASRVAAFMREDARRADGWRCGLPGMEPTPGLMLGLSGIGWGQLRATMPERVPPAWTPASSIACAVSFDSQLRSI